MENYPDFIEATGYGVDKLGLCGINCYHSFSPFIPGISVRSYTDEQLSEMNRAENTPKAYRGKEYTSSQAAARQRELERAMRLQRRRIKLLETGEADEDDILNAQIRYRVTMGEYVDFSRQMHLPQQLERIYTDGLGDVKGTGSEALRENKKELAKYSEYHYNKDGTIIVTDDWKAKGKVSIPKKYKQNAVIETITRYKNGIEQIDRSLYDEAGWIKTQIHSGPHNKPTRHKYGEKGEHGHNYSWYEDGTRKSREERELFDFERKEHKDIL